MGSDNWSDNWKILFFPFRKKNKKHPTIRVRTFSFAPKNKKISLQQNSTNIAEAKGGFQDFLAQSHLHAELSPEEVEAFMERTLEEMQVALGSPGGFPWYGSGEVGKNVLGNKCHGWLLGFFWRGSCCSRNLYPKFRKATQSRRKGTQLTDLFEISPQKKDMFFVCREFFFFKSCFCGFSGQEDDVPKRAEKERNSSIDQRMPRWLRILNFHISLWNDGTKNSFDRFLRNKVNPHRYSSFFFEIMKTNGVKDVF